MMIYFAAPIMAITTYCIIRKKKFVFDNKDVTIGVVLLLSFFVPFVTFAFRDPSIGIDTSGYCNDYYYIGQKDILDLLIEGYGSYEIGFVILNKLLYLINDDSTFLLIIISLIINYLYARAIANYKEMWLLALLIYFFLGNYLYNLNIMRQAIAVGIILNVMSCLEQKRYFKYIFGVWVASLFHVFAIVMLLFIPVRILIKTKRQLIIVSIILGVFTVNSLELVHLIVLEYFVHFDYYFRNDFHADQQFGVTSFAYTFIEAIISFFILKKYKMNDEMNARHILYVICLVVAALGLIMMPIFGIYERIAKFFQPFLILAIPEAFKNIEKHQLILKSIVVILSFIYYTYIILTNSYLIVPYKFY